MAGAKWTAIVTTGVFLGLGLTACGNPELSDAYGQFEAEETIISSENSGRLLRFDLKEGDRPQAGAVVALVDTTQTALQKKELTASAAAVRTQIERLNAQIGIYQAQLETAQKEMNRIESLLKDDAATRQQADTALGRVNTLEKHITAVETEKQSVFAELETLNVRIQQAEDRLRRASVINPIQGIVLNTYAERHEMITTGKPLYRIADLNEMTLRVYVSGAQLPQVRLGEEVEVWIDRNEEENERLSGTVSWISSKAEFTPRMIQTKEERVAQVYAVKVRVPNPDGKIKIGMPGEVNF